MLQRYRTMGAMVALDTFTVDDLARLTGVAKDTIYKVIAREREKENVEVLEEIPAGRGGRVKRFQIVPSKRGSLLMELRRVEDVGRVRLARDANLATHPEIKEEAALSALLAAEDVLLRQLPDEHDPQRKQELIDLAQISLADASGSGALDSLAPGGQALEAHRAAARFLLTLALSEQEAAEQQDESVPHNELTERFKKVVALAAAADEKSLVDDLRERFQTSRHAHTATHGRRVGPVLVVPFTGSEAQQAVPNLFEIMNQGRVRYRLQQLHDLRQHPWSSRTKRTRVTCVLALPSLLAPAMHHDWHHALHEFLIACRGADSQPLVVSDLFDPRINQEACALGLQYLAVEGLQPSGLLGVITRLEKGANDSSSRASRLVRQ
ncbi:hypothetical protein [Streptomyces sp. NPDC002402]